MSARAPSAAHVPIHTTPRLKPDEAERIIFLGDLEPRTVHFLTGNRNERARSVPCDGAGCLHCSEDVPQRQNFYAPALVHLHGDKMPDGAPVWERVVFYVPKEAAGGFAGTLRGQLFSVWRHCLGNSWRLRSRACGRVAELVEPTFDIEPILRHCWNPSLETKAVLAVLLHKLPARIIPPILTRSALPTEKLSEGQRAEVRKLLDAYLHPAKKPSIDEQLDEIEKLAFERTGTTIANELKDRLPDGHPAKRGKESA